MTHARRQLAPVPAAIGRDLVDIDEAVHAWARVTPRKNYRTTKTYLGSAAKFEAVDFSHAVLAALERKVSARTRSRGTLTNRQLSML